MLAQSRFGKTTKKAAHNRTQASGLQVSDPGGALRGLTVFLPPALPWSCRVAQLDPEVAIGARGPVGVVLPATANGLRGAPSHGGRNVPSLVGMLAKANGACE